MDGNQKFWIWFWLVSFSGLSIIALSIGTAVEHSEIGEAQEFKVFLDKGYTPLEASCSISQDLRICEMVKEQNAIRVEGK